MKKINIHILVVLIIALVQFYPDIRHSTFNEEIHNSSVFAEETVSDKIEAGETDTEETVTEKTDAENTAYIDYNPSYIEPFINTIIIKPYFNKQAFEFDISSELPGSQKIKYKPNVPVNFGASILHPYLGFGLSFSSKLPINEQDTSRYGTSEYFHFLLNYYGRNWGIDFSFHEYKGFYIDEPEKHVPGYQAGDPNPQLNNLTSNGIELNVYYIFSGDTLSLGAAFDQSEKQKKSSHSFLFMISFSQFRLRNNTAIIPQAQQQFYGELGTFSDGDFGTLSFSPGYAGTLTFWNYYLSAALFIGPGIQGQTFSSSTGTSKLGGWVSRANLRASIGYQAETVMTGFTFLFDNTEVRHKSSPLAIDARIILVNFFFGVKF